MSKSVKEIKEAKAPISRSRARMGYAIAIFATFVVTQNAAYRVFWETRWDRIALFGAILGVSVLLARAAKKYFYHPAWSPDGTSADPEPTKASRFVYVVLTFICVFAWWRLDPIEGFGIRHAAFFASLAMIWLVVTTVFLRPSRALKARKRETWSPMETMTAS